ncbi:catalytic activity protein [[Candida] boidinii]|nr:catalytic activity protein [[Candida] boidinii]
MYNDRLKSSPNQFLGYSTLSAKHIHTFGCACTMTVLPYPSNEKIDTRAAVGIYLGYSPTTYGHKVFLLTKPGDYTSPGSFEDSQHVRFYPKDNMYSHMYKIGKYQRGYSTTDFVQYDERINNFVNLGDCDYDLRDHSNNHPTADDSDDDIPIIELSRSSNQVPASDIPDSSYESDSASPMEDNDDDDSSDYQPSDTEDIPVNSTTHIVPTTESHSQEHDSSIDSLLESQSHSDLSPHDNSPSIYSSKSSTGKSLRSKGTVKDTPSVITAKQAAVRKKLFTKTLQHNTASDVVGSSINTTTDSSEIPSNLPTVNHSDSAINTTDSQVKSDHHQLSEGLPPDSCNSQPEDSGKSVIFTPQKEDDSTNIGLITTDSTISDHPESALTHTTPGARITTTPTVTTRRPPHPSSHPELSLLSKQKPSWLTKNLSSLNSKGRPRRRPDDYHTSPGSQLSSYTPLYNKNSERNTFSNHLGLHHVLGPTLPRNYSQALHSSESGNWKAAIQEELDSHSSLHTWDPHPIITNDKKLLSKTVWVFAKKSDGRYKARLVARGDHQKPHTYQDTYSPTLRPELARSIPARCAQDHWYFAQFDIKTAYLNASIDTEIYLAAPQGTPPVDVPKGSKVIYRLQRALYGLKQSGRLWHDTISLHLRSLNFTTQPSVFPSVFYRSDATIGLFVDDIIVTAKSLTTLQKISKHLSDVYELKELLPDETGYQRFFGMNLFVQRNSKDQVETISLNQSSYIHQCRS